MKKCPNCKREIDENSTFCEYCGHQIKRSKKALWIVLAIVGGSTLIGIIVALVLILTNVFSNSVGSQLANENVVMPDVYESDNSAINNENRSSINSNSGDVTTTEASDYDFVFTEEEISNDNYSSTQAKSQYEILLDTDMRNKVLSESDLYSLTPRELTYLRNSVYARHGYVFKSDELNQYFKQFSWYHPDYSVTGSVLNKTEQANVNMIKDYQNDYGKEYKPM